MTLGWSTSSTSSSPQWGDDKIDPDDILQFDAGTEWRLIGTYNSVDAHRVFRVGLALGRRFAQVPIAPPDSESFRKVLETHDYEAKNERIADEILDIITRIYAAHAESQGAVLGPAPFLTIPRYVRAAISSQEGIDLHEFVAEGYLAAFGTWLARLDNDTLAHLGSKLSSNDILGSQWEWVRGQLGNLA